MSLTLSKSQNEKFKELVIYVAQKSVNDNKFGSIKLNKIIAYADMLHFAKTGKTITTAKYMKQPMGVVARCMKPTLRELEESRELALVTKEAYGHIARVPTALRLARADMFTGSEIEAIEEVLNAFREHHGTSVSSFSHDVTPNWDYLPVDTNIPVSSLLYPSKYRLTPEENSHFKQLLRDTEWGKELTNAWTAA